MQLQDKRVILTGATGGIGQAMAIQLAKQGAKLGLVGTRHDALNELLEHLKQYDTECITIPADVTTEQGQKQIVHDMHEKFGGIDVLINRNYYSKKGKRSYSLHTRPLFYIKDNYQYCFLLGAVISYR